MPRILVTGVNGQVGSFVAEQLVADGHEVVGTTWPIDAPLSPAVTRSPIPLEASTASALVDGCGHLDGIIHLAGMSSVAVSWNDPLAAFELNARLTAALAYALIKKPHITFVHASSAEIFGRSSGGILSETTPMAPVNPYGVGKASAHILVKFARESMGLPMSNLIPCLCESERRPPHFVFRKITRALASIHLGLQEKLFLGNTDAVRDFIYAGDAARAAIRLALDPSVAGDYVCGSGEGHSIGDVARVACELLSLDPGQAIEFDPSLVRPTDIPSMVGDSSRLRSLGWSPTLGFRQLVERILRHDISALQTENKK